MSFLLACFGPLTSYRDVLRRCAVIRTSTFTIPSVVAEVGHPVRDFQQHSFSPCLQLSIIRNGSARSLLAFPEACANSLTLTLQTVISENNQNFDCCWSDSSNLENPKDRFVERSILHLCRYLVAFYFNSLRSTILKIGRFRPKIA